MKFVNDPEYSAFVQCLRNIRKQAGLTQTALAEKIGKDQTYVSKYESRERRLDFIEVRAICKALNITLSELEALFDEQRLFFRS